MATTFLRSGPLAPLQALGENGQPVWRYAMQIREALRLRNQCDVANVLAIPQLNDSGDRLDWYAPVAGNAVAWSAASRDERESLIEQLESFHKTVTQLAQKTRTADNAALKLFAALLLKVMHFPDQNHIWLVNGQAVMTFWGFIRQDDKPRQDPLACLRPARTAVPEISTIAVTTPPGVPSPSLSLLDEPTSPVAETFTPPAMPRPRKWGRLWTLAVGMTALAGALFWWQTLPVSPPSMPINADIIASTQPEALPFVLPDISLLLPLTSAEVEAPKPVIAPREIPANALVMPANSVRAGTVAFLNGNWRVTVEIKASRIGRQPVIRYSVNKGKGSARITLADGVSCRVPVESGLMQSGTLPINSRTTARCIDGSHYRINLGLSSCNRCQIRL